MGEPESTLVLELRKLAGSPEGDRFELVHDGVPMRVVYQSGSASNLALVTAYDRVATRTSAVGGAYRGSGPLAAIRPMTIRIRPENGDDERAKEQGMNVEVQTGDAAFDPRVYVDTPAPEPVVVAVLGDDVRAAVLELFELGFRTIEIDDLEGDVVARIVHFATLEDQTSTGRRAASAFARLARGLPKVAPLPGQYPAHPLGRAAAVLGLVDAVLFFGAMPLYAARTSSVSACADETSDAWLCLTPAFVGVALGLLVGLVAFALAVIYTKRFRGRSDSASTNAAFALAVFVFVWFSVGLATSVVLVENLR